MKKRIIAILLVLTMLLALSVPGTALSAVTNADDGNRFIRRSDLADYDNNAAIFSEDDVENPEDVPQDQDMTQQEVAAFLLRFAGLKESQLGTYPDDYNALAESTGLTAGLDYKPEAACPINYFNEMLKNLAPLYEALHAEQMEPLFINGMAQPIFDYDEAIRFCVYVESNYDTDADGKLDLVKTLVQLPGAVLNGMKVASIYEARPYITGCNTSSSVPNNIYRQDGFNNQDLYAKPAARVPAGITTTAAAAEAANKDDWYYYNPYERAWCYEDLTWYDYYLTRGYAVIESGGIGTKGSEGFETCGSDLEIDAFKCVIEWLTGDRIAYSDKTGNIEIKADWSNGNVGMTGRSYSGTTQFGLATTGVKGLKAIVPVAGIASWYEYTNSQGISTRTGVNYVDGLAWYCTGRYLDPDDYATIAEKYGNYLWQLRNDQLASNGDYSEVWRNRDYTPDWEKIKCPALIVHGLNDDNVRTKQSDLMYQAYAKSGQNVKMLLHQGAHMTPTYPAGGYEMYIDDQLYDEILNKWFSHYLYGVDNGIEDMPNVTAQSNTDGSWNYYNSWETENELILKAAYTAEKPKTTINSAHNSNGITSNNWRNLFTANSTASSALYKIDIANDTTLKGAVAVHIKAAADTLPVTMSALTTSSIDVEMPDSFDWNTIMKNGEIDWDAVSKDPTIDNDMKMMLMRDAGSASDFIVNDAVSPAAYSVNSEDLPVVTPIGKGDALMMSAMLVDIDESGFKTYNTGSGSQVPTTLIKEKGAWMGGGLENFDLVEYAQTDVTYKVIARGWMDLYNPDAGYDSSTADRSKRVDLVPGQFYDYTLYLQPNLYTIEEGHSLALVIYTFEPGRYSQPAAGQNYTITIDNSATFASIPVNDAVTPPPYSDVNIYMSTPLTKIVAGCKANIPVDISFAETPSEVAIQLVAPDNTVVQSINAFADGRYIFSLPVENAVAGTYKIIAGGKSLSIECVESPINLWAPVVTVSEIDGAMGTLVTFADKVSFSELQKSASIDGEPANATLYSDNAIAVSTALTAGKTLKLSGVKYTELFPSYTFTFSVTLS